MIEEPKRSLRSIGWTAFALFLIGIGPMLLSLGAGWIANSHKCVLTEGGAGLCPVFGVEVGALLHTFFTLGWLSKITIWLVPVSIVIAVVAAIRWWRERA